jgi:MoaA/NifB/PqqE/SkfB family radical SAM enzyme
MKQIVKVKAPIRLLVEFTSRCNLRCVYCHKSQPDSGNGIDLPDEVLEKIVAYAVSNPASHVCVNGNGETTLRKNWDDYCDRILEKNPNLGIITNLSKEFTDKELSTLCRFKSIEVSCDTADPELFRKLRRGAELERLLNNMELIKSAAIRENHQPPLFSWSCVLNDRNVFNLDDYVLLALQHGVQSFSLCNLIKHPEVTGVLSVKHITELSDEKFNEAAQIVLETVRILMKNKIKFHGIHGLMQTILRKYEAIGSSTAALTVPAQKNDCPAPLQPAGHTRDCVEPWANMFIQSNASVSPCCVMEGNPSLTGNSGIEELFNSEFYVRLREGLLTGNLCPACRTCPGAEWTSIDNYKNKIRELLSCR